MMPAAGSAQSTDAAERDIKFAFGAPAGQRRSLLVRPDDFGVQLNVSRAPGGIRQADGTRTGTWASQSQFSANLIDRAKSTWRREH